jgi:phage major head subunit gpT-like protein
VDIVFFTGVDVPRMDFWTGEKYLLKFNPKGADLSLLNNGAPVLDNHNLDGSASQKGVVEKAWQDGEKFKATLRFSKRENVNDLWGDIQDRIITKFSMGVEFLTLKNTEEKGLKIRTAEAWRPFELSIAPVPADFGTTILAAEAGGISQRANAQEERTMPDDKTTGTSSSAEDTTTTLTAEKIYEDRLKNERENGIIQELARVTAILKVNQICGLDSDFANQHIKAKTSIEKFRELAIDRQAQLALGRSQTRDGRISLVSDESDTRRELMGNAVFGMMNPKNRKEDKDNPFLHLSIKQIAEESVRFQRGIRGPVPMADVATLAMQTTADFAAVLENTARKQLLAKYNAANPTYRLWCKPSTTPDFKSMTRVRLGETPSFLKVPEGAQITIGLMTDQKETYSLATYGRGVSFTRQMLINDDLGAFNDLIGAFGQQAARLENKVVYLILANSASTSSPYAMADGYALIDGAHHYNTDTGVLGNTAFDSMFGLMGVQKGVDGETVLNLIPKYLLVPRALESTARSVTTATGPNLAASSQNWFAGRLEVVSDGELDTNGSGVVHYFMVADPEIAPVIEYCHLEGAEGPQFIRKDNEQGVLGIQFYAYLDFAAKAVDWRGIVYSTGA